MPDNNRSVSAFTALGTARTDKVQLPESTFDGTINMPVMHQAVKAFMANQRQGNASTKVRKYVVGGNQKPWKQKGTGRARQGSTRAPQWVGGGTVFGPTPRPYDEYVPRQVRALAKKSALNARANEGAIYVIDAFNFDAPKTTAMINLIGRLDVADRKVLVLTDGVKPNVFLSGRNIPNVHVMPYSDSSTYHILWSDVVLVEAGALGTTLEPIAEAAAAPKRERPAAQAKVAKTAAKKTPAKKSATKAARKAAPKAAAKKSSKSVAKKSTAKKRAPSGQAKKSTKKKEK
jgi:large subunit ribosomal protein L4